MKPIIAFIVIVMLFSLELVCHPVIKNPMNPASRNCGRQLPLKAGKALLDDGENFFFTWPYNLKISSDRSLYVLDKDQFLRFNPDGKFIKNLLKKGQGAGEIARIANYLLTGNNEILIQDHSPNKLLRIDLNGKAIDEKRIYKSKYMTLFHEGPNNYFFLSEAMGETNGKAIVVDVEEQILAAAKKDLSIEKKLSFPLRNFVYKTPAAFAMVKTTPFLIERYKENLFFISHTQEYGIKLIDLDSKKVILEFNREYKRVKVTAENKKYVISGQFVIEGKFHESPTPGYMNDIQCIRFSGNRVWVFTSTVDKEKGVLVDIFEPDGKYIDCFYLKFQNKDCHYRLEQGQLAIMDNRIYVIEQEEESGRWLIGKYALNLISHPYRLPAPRARGH